MGRVPTYQQQVLPNVLPGARMSANADADSFGGAQARQMGEVGNALFRVGAAVHDWANRPAVQEAKRRAKVAEANDAVNRACADGRTLSQELYSLKGQDSTKVLDIGTTRWNEVRQKYLSEIKDEETRQMFASKFDAHMNDQLARLSEQQIRNTDKVEQEVQTARILELHQQGLVLSGDPANLNTHADLLRGVEANAREINKREAPEVRNLKVKEAQALYVNDIVGSMAKAGNYDAAIQFLEKYHDQADPRTRGELLKGLKDKRDKDTQDKTVQDTSLKIFNSGVPEEKQLAEARKLPAEIADQVEQKIVRWNRQREAVKRDAEEASMQGVNDQLLPELAKGTLTYEAAEEVIKKSDLSPAAQGEHLLRLRSQIDAQFDHKAKVEAKAKASALFKELSELSDEKLAQRNLEMDRIYLGDNVAPFEGRVKRYKSGIKTAQDEREKRTDEAVRKATKALEDSLTKGVKESDLTPAEVIERNQRIWDADTYIRNAVQGVPPEKFDAALEQARDTVLKEVVLRTPGTFRDSKESVPFASRGRVSRDKGYTTYDLSPDERKRLATAKAVPESAPFDADTQTFTLSDPDEVNAYLRKHRLPNYRPPDPKDPKSGGYHIGLVIVDANGNPLHTGSAEEAKKKEQEKAKASWRLDYWENYRDDPKVKAAVSSIESSQNMQEYERWKARQRTAE